MSWIEDLGKLIGGMVAGGVARSKEEANRMIVEHLAPTPASPSPGYNAAKDRLDELRNDADELPKPVPPAPDTLRTTDEDDGG